MRNWIYGLVASLPGWLASPARAIASRIYGVYDYWVRFAKWIKGGVRTLRDKIAHAAHQLGYVLAEVYAVLYYYRHVFIPLYVVGVANDVRKYILKKMVQLVNGALSAVYDLQDWARRELDKLRDLARSWGSALGRDLAKLRNTVDAILSLTNALLGSPSRMASWLAGAMISAILRYMHQHRNQIAIWLFRSSTQFAAAIAREIENILVRLL